MFRRLINNKPIQNVYKRNFSDKYVWMNDEENTLFGLGHKESLGELRPKIKFHLGEQDEF